MSSPNIIMTLNESHDLPLPSLQALIARHGVLAVGYAYLRAAITRRKHPPDRPAVDLSDHIRRDIGLGPRPQRMQGRGWDF
jgi:hypothetical protein